MPIYEYKCTQCSLRFERFQRMTDEPVETCPRCCGRVRRVLQPVGVVFKGSGFYSTDNRKTTSLGSASTNHKDTNGTPAEEKSGESETSKATDTATKATETSAAGRKGET